MLAFDRSIQIRENEFNDPAPRLVRNLGNKNSPLVSSLYTLIGGGCSPISKIRFVKLNRRVRLKL